VVALYPTQAIHFFQVAAYGRRADIEQRTEFVHGGVTVVLNMMPDLPETLALQVHYLNRTSHKRA
jgi:hypothetical protein